MRKVNDICIWAHSFQYLKWFGTTSLQFLNGPRGKPFRSNPNHDIISYLKLCMTSMSVSMNFILRITYLNLIANLIMQIMNMSCKCLSRFRNSNMWGHGQKIQWLPRCIPMHKLKWTSSYRPIDRAFNSDWLHPLDTEGGCLDCN